MWWNMLTENVGVGIGVQILKTDEWLFGLANCKLKNKIVWWTALKTNKSPVSTLHFTLNDLNVENVCFDMNVFTLHCQATTKLLHVRVMLEIKTKSVVVFFRQVYRVAVLYQVLVYSWFAHDVIVYISRFKGIIANPIFCDEISGVIKSVLSPCWCTEVSRFIHFY